VNETKTNKALGSLHTIAFYQFQGGNGLDVLLSRKAVVELVEWGGDPEKTLQNDGRLSPRSSFASFVKGHLKKGKPWDDSDKQKVRRFVEKLEKYRSTEVFEKQNKAIESLGQERKDLMKDQKENVSVCCGWFMFKGLRT
jgi:light-regulated signal transduction histidine kinase (bacteriophytochrome)